MRTRHTTSAATTTRADSTEPRVSVGAGTAAMVLPKPDSRGRRAGHIGHGQPGSQQLIAEVHLVPLVGHPHFAQQPPVVAAVSLTGWPHEAHGPASHARTGKRARRRELRTAALGRVDVEQPDALDVAAHQAHVDGVAVHHAHHVRHVAARSLGHWPIRRCQRRRHRGRWRHRPKRQRRRGRRPGACSLAQVPSRDIARWHIRRSLHRDQPRQGVRWRRGRCRGGPQIRDAHDHRNHDERDDEQAAPATLLVHVAFTAGVPRPYARGPAAGPRGTPGRDRP